MPPLINRLLDRRRPVVTLLLAFACAGMPSAAAQEPPRDSIASLARQSNLIDGLLAARASAGSNAGMWPAAAGLDETTTTAMLAMAIGVANGSPLPMKPK